VPALLLIDYRQNFFSFGPPCGQILFAEFEAVEKVGWLGHKFIATTPRPLVLLAAMVSVLSRAVGFRLRCQPPRLTNTLSVASTGRVILARFFLTPHHPHSELELV
jgi:hypothetical protein